MAEENKKIPESKSVNSKVAGSKTVMKTPKEWAVMLKVKLYYLAGVKVYAGWAEDQRITQAEFERKLNEWLKRPVGGRR